jgi:hypothetical protein
VLKFNLSHISPLFEPDNFENIMDTSLNLLKRNVEKADKNISYLSTYGSILVIVRTLCETSNGGVSAN